MSNSPLRSSDGTPLSNAVLPPLSLSDSVLAEFNYDINKVKTLIEPALQAPDRCQVASSYIQAVITDHATFLVTNLSLSKQPQVTEVSNSWLMGRSITCAIPIHHLTISRCHAAIIYHPTDGFCITDLKSSNGTWVNCYRLQPMERYPLNDGSLIRVGCVQVEFFATGLPDEAVDEDEEFVTEELTCY